MFRLVAGDDIDRNSAIELHPKPNTGGNEHDSSRRKASATAAETAEEEVAEMASKSPPAEMGHSRGSVYLPRLAVVSLADGLRG